MNQATYAAQKYNMNIITITKVVTEPQAGTCMAYRAAQKENYEGNVSDGGREEEDDMYDPEMDSPSSWTTNSTSSKQKCGAFPAIMRICSNAILILLTVTGIIIGALEMTGRLLLPKYSDNDNESIGGLIVFGAIVGGAVSLILVNVSWSYRGKHSFNLQAPGSSDFQLTCPTAQVASSCIVLFVGAVLIPTYRRDTTGIFVIIFGIMFPLLVMVNAPLLVPVDEERFEKEENDVEAVPGNLESVVIPKEGRKRHKKSAFCKLT
jgi:hypothetical protein